MDCVLRLSPFSIPTTLISWHRFSCTEYLQELIAFYFYFYSELECSRNIIMHILYGDLLKSLLHLLGGQLYIWHRWTHSLSQSSMKWSEMILQRVHAEDCVQWVGHCRICNLMLQIVVSKSISIGFGCIIAGTKLGDWFLKFLELFSYMSPMLFF